MEYVDNPMPNPMPTRELAARISDPPAPCPPSGAEFVGDDQEQLTVDEEEREDFSRELSVGSDTWFGNREPRLSESVKINILPTFDTTDALTVLRQLLQDAEAQWSSSLQSWGIAHIMESKHDVLAVGPTGSGKTFLWLIPAILERQRGNITLVIVPLLSLLEDYERRLGEYSVPYHVYSPDVTPTTGLPPDVRVVLATVNRVPTELFQSTMKAIHLKTPFSRFVLDEVHYVLTSGDYREEFSKVHETRFIPVPLVLMSATVPPHLEKIVKDRYQLTNPYVFIRASTERSGTKYSVLEPSQTEEDLCHRAVTIVNEELGHLHPRDRILVFVSSKRVGERLAHTLFCDFYFSGKNASGGNGLRSTRRSIILYNWRRGENPVLVSTSALAAGNDYPFTRLVLHAGTPTGMLDFIQETGRAGRDHRPAKSIVIPFQSIDWILRKNPEDYGGVKAMMEYIEGGSCRRYMLNKFNDGERRSCKVRLSSPSP